MRKVAVVGTTAWGTTLGVVLARNGLEVILWARTEEEARELNIRRENVARLPGIPLLDNLGTTASPSEALSEADLTILAVPSQKMRSNLQLIKEHLRASTLLLSISKGIEIGTTERMSEVIADEVRPPLKERIAVLSGPNFAQEVVQGLPTATVVASANLEFAREIQKELSSPNFWVYFTKDVVGVELGGALKNTIALSVGMSDGLDYGDNARAALITWGLAEVIRLGVAAGADPRTFFGLAGMGDLIATCTSQLSRNRYVGQELARGRVLEEILASMNGIAEGVDTTVAALKLAGRLGVGMPITQVVYQVLFEGHTVREAVHALMETAP